MRRAAWLAQAHVLDIDDKPSDYELDSDELNSSWECDEHPTRPQGRPDPSPRARRLKSGSVAKVDHSHDNLRSRRPASSGNAGMHPYPPPSASPKASRAVTACLQHRSSPDGVSQLFAGRPASPSKVLLEQAESPEFEESDTSCALSSADLEDRPWQRNARLTAWPMPSTASPSTARDDELSMPPRLAASALSPWQ